MDFLIAIGIFILIIAFVFLIVVLVWGTTIWNTKALIASIPTGVTPAGMAATPNGRYLYVANNNNYGIAGSDSVTVVDLKSQQVVTTIQDASFNEPYTVTINADGSAAYVTNSNSNSVTVIDIATNTVTSVVTGFDGPSGLTIVPGTTAAYVNNYGGPLGVGSGNGTTVQKLNLATNTLIGSPITVDLAPAAIVASPDGLYVYTINYTTGNTGAGTMSRITVSNDEVLVDAVMGLSGPFGIVLNRSGSEAYVTNFGSNNFAPYGTTVSVIDLLSLAISSTYTLGIQPSGIALYQNRYLVVTNYNTLYAGSMFTDLTAGQGTAQIIDLQKQIILGTTLPVGQSPSAVVLSGEQAYISNYTANTVSIANLGRWIK